MLPQLKSLTVITGHYGTGKTNLSLNLAKLYSESERTSIVDLDTVNPYFRTADYAGQLPDIEFVLPYYAGTELDIPSLSPRVDGVIAAGERVIIDVGGDDVGAIALGRYSAAIAARGYDMLYVFSARRPETASPEDAARLLRDIEAASRLRVTGLVNSTNLARETTRETVDSGSQYASELSKITGLPVLFTAVQRSIARDDEFAVNIYVKNLWE